MAEVIQTKVFKSVDELNEFCDGLHADKVKKLDSHLSNNDDLIFVLHYEINNGKSLFKD